MSSSTPRSLRFTRLSLAMWRNFTSIDIALQSRVFLIGPNASGKSNFLDVFRFLHDVVAVGGGFQDAVRRRGGVSKLRCLAARRYPDVGIKVTVGGDENEGLWEYQLAFSQDNLQRPIIKQEIVKENGKILLERPNRDDGKDPERLYQTYLEQVNVNREFRDLSEFFGIVRYLHLVPQLVREPDRFVGRRYDPFGSDFLERIASTQERTRNARLRRIANALKVAVPQLNELQFYRDEKGSPHLRGRYEHWRPQGAWQTEEQFSDGTLRLFGLLWAVLDSGGPLLLEEPELSLHPDVVRFLPNIFANMQRKTGRQVILSSHSADLLRDEGIGLNEVLLLRPSSEGTVVTPALGLAQAESLLNAHIPLPDIVLPETRPPKPQQMSLLFE